MRQQMQELLDEIARLQAALEAAHGRRRAMIRDIAAIPGITRSKVAEMCGVSVATVAAVMTRQQAQLKKAERHLKTAEYLERRGWNGQGYRALAEAQLQKSTTP